jgi:DegV family protein with EDD domain
MDGDTHITTSQPTPADFAQVYRKLLKETDEIVSIQVTSKLSGTYQSALRGRDSISGKHYIEVIDSLTTTMGLGLLTITAARLAQAGASLSAIVEEMKKSIPKTHVWGMFDTLKYALRGGRLGKAKALLGSVLPVKALLTMHDGELHPTGFARTRAKGIERLIDNVKNCLNIQDIAVVHSTTPDEAQNLHKRINSICDNIPIYISRLGPALGVHGGPGMLALALREKADGVKQEARVSDKIKKLASLPSWKKQRGLNITHH